MALRDALRRVNLNPRQLTAPSKPQKDTILKLAGYIDYFGYSSVEILTRVREFRFAVDKLFRDPIETLERNLGNAARLAHDETSFIQQAYHLNSMSQNLYRLLTRSISCSGVHAAQLYMSGFLASDPSFELLITDCRKRHWNSAKCRWLENLVAIRVIGFV